MKETRVASRYAKSLLSLANERGVLDQTYEDMKLVALACEENKALSLLLKSPIVKSDKKIKIFDEIFSKHISELSSTFITTITKKRRENYLLEITIEFQRQYKHHNNIITAVVTSATGLDEAIRKEVLKVVKESVKSEVELVEHQDKALIGGLILRLGDKQVDASIQRKINDLRNTFSQKYFNEN